MQAALPLDLGVSTNEAYIPEKLMIELQTKKEGTFTFPLKKSFMFQNKLFTPLELYPHAKASLRFWHDGQKATVMGVGTIPFFEHKEDVEPLKQGPWQIYALRSKEPLEPHTLVIHEDSVRFCLSDGTVKEESLDPTKAPLYIFEEGWGGYGTTLQAGNTTFFAPLFISIQKADEGERALLLSVDGKTYTLQEGIAPLPMAGMLARLAPQKVELPFTTLLRKTDMLGDIPEALIQVNDQQMTLSPKQGGHYKGYDFYLSFWDKKHISLTVSYDPLQKIGLYLGTSLVSLGTIILLGRRR